MKRRYIFLSILLIMIFVGGLLTGTMLSNQNQHENQLIKNAPYSSKKPAPKAMPNLDKTQSRVLVGYVQDFRDPNQIDYTKLTHIIFSFVHPTKDGQILFTGDYATKNLKSMVANAHKHHTKAMLAVGGWFHMNGGESYDYFAAALANPSSQAKLADELMGVVERENLDGIDIDFEHPRTEADGKNLHQFIKMLSKKLHANNKELSIAVHSKIHGQTLTELGYVKYEPSMFQYVDYVNIMAYDGQWDGGYHAENLSPYPFTESIVGYWANLFDANKLPKEKLILGVPFYGQPSDPTIKPVSYEAIIENNTENAGKDSVVMNGTTYYYNGKSMMTRKTELALNHGFGGMMIWELGLDAKGTNSLTNTLFKSVTATNIKSYYSLKK